MVVSKWRYVGTKNKEYGRFCCVSGISRPTLSKYFNDPASVRSSTKARIEAALEQHDYRPNMYAMNQNRRLTRNIGIIVPYLADPFFAETARNIENLVIEAGYRPILLSSHGSPEQEIENLALCVELSRLECFWRRLVGHLMSKLCKNIAPHFPLFCLTVISMT